MVLVNPKYCTIKCMSQIWPSLRTCIPTSQRMIPTSQRMRPQRSSDFHGICIHYMCIILWVCMNTHAQLNVLILASPTCMYLHPPTSQLGRPQMSSG